MQRAPIADFLQTVRRTVARHHMLVPGDRVLVALSGGPDSTALLSALAALAAEYEIELRAAHLNHQLRGSESLRDQHCAEAAAQRFAVPCTVHQVNGLSDGPGLEARSRERRYAFLLRIAAGQGCTKIATGHTLNDQAETVMMRLLRGTGWDGLTGIPPVRDNIIRPLIDCTRQDVLAFLEASDLAYCHDSSNESRRFLRNRVRHDVMPVLHSISPAVARRLAGAAENIRAEAVFLEEHVAAALARAADGSLPIASIAAVPSALRPRLLRAWLRQQRGDLKGLTARHLHAIISLAEGVRPNARASLPQGQQVVREYGCLRFVCGPPVPVPPEQVLVAGSTARLDSGWQISSETESGGPTWRLPRDLWEMAADAEAITAPLLVRTVHPGDRIRPLGVRGHRKLQDVFVDHKLPVRVRRSCPVVEMDGEILWVPGIVRGAQALISSKTRSIVRLVATKTDVAGA